MKVFTMTKLFWKSYNLSEKLNVLMINQNKNLCRSTYLQAVKVKKLSLWVAMESDKQYRMTWQYFFNIERGGKLKFRQCIADRQNITQLFSTSINLHSLKEGCLKVVFLVSKGFTAIDPFLLLLLTFLSSFVVWVNAWMSDLWTCMTSKFSFLKRFANFFSLQKFTEFMKKNWTNCVKLQTLHYISLKVN